MNYKERVTDSRKQKESLGLVGCFRVLKFGSTFFGLILEFQSQVSACKVRKGEECLSVFLDYSTLQTYKKILPA
jgi:hypothetical protein